MSMARRAQDRAARGLSVHFIDMNDPVCRAGSGPWEMERGGMLRYPDGDPLPAA